MKTQRKQTDLKAQLVAVRRQLVAEGLVADTGERRAGQIVWGLTAKGKAEMAKQAAPTHGLEGLAIVH